MIRAAPTVVRDREELLAEITMAGASKLREGSFDLLCDRAVVLKAVSMDGLSLRYAAPVLRSDRQLVLAAVSKTGSALQFASSELRDDPTVVQVAVAGVMGRRPAVPRKRFVLHLGAPLVAALELVGDEGHDVLRAEEGEGEGGDMHRVMAPLSRRGYRYRYN